MKTLKKFAIVVLIVGIVFVIAKETSRKVEVPEQQNSSITRDEISEKMNEEQFRQETILRARTAVNDDEKAKEEKRHQDAVAAEKAQYDAEMVKIESEYESIRAAELELGATGVSSLK